MREGQDYGFRVRMQRDAVTGCRRQLKAVLIEKNAPRPRHAHPQVSQTWRSLSMRDSTA